jgi:hypothetical protein
LLDWTGSEFCAQDSKPRCFRERICGKDHFNCPLNQSIDNGDDHLYNINMVLKYILKIILIWFKRDYITMA